MKILLIEPPYMDLYGKTKAMVKPYFPLGLGYIAASLRCAGHQVKLLVKTNETSFKDFLLKSVESFQPDVIGFTAMTTNFSRASELAKEIKQISSVPIIIGGHHVSAFKGKILQDHPEFDFVVYGEGEDTIVELVNTLAKSTNRFRDINGIVWRNGEDIICNPDRILRTDLDNLPFPARDLVDISNFSTHSHIAGGKSATILTSRGCPFDCIFCSAHTVDGRKYRPHSVNYVMSEIRELVEHFGMKYIFIQDDTFTIDKNRVFEICSALSDMNYKVRLGCFSRVDIIDYQLAIALKKSGFDHIIFGIESGDEEILRKIGKKTSLRKAKESIRLCNKAGLKTTASIVIGLPFDTLATINRTIQFAYELNPTIVIFNPLVPFPGSKIFNNLLHTPTSVQGWTKYITVNVPPFSFVEGLTPNDIYRIASNGQKRFYMRPSQILRMLRTVRSFNDLKEYVLSAFGTLFR